MTRFAISVLSQMRVIWKPYMYGLMGAVALVLCVGAVGGLGQAIKANAPALDIPSVPVSIELALIAVLATIVVYFVKARALAKLASMLLRTFGVKDRHHLD